MMSCRGGPAKTCASKNVRFRERERVRSASESPVSVIGSVNGSALSIAVRYRSCDNSDVCLEDKLECTPFLGGSTVRSRSAQQSAIHRCCSRSSSHTSRSPTSQLCKDGQQGSNCQLPTMCKDVKCDDGQEQSFLEPLKAGRVKCVTQHEQTKGQQHKTKNRLTTEDKRKNPRSTSADGAKRARHAEARMTPRKMRWPRNTNKPKHKTGFDSACLKHCNFLNRQKHSVSLLFT